MTQSKGIWKRALVPALAGGLAFWVANFVISLTPIAAEYRAALSIAYLPMLLESLVGGLVIGFGVSCFLLRFFDKIPTRSPVLKAVLLSLMVLVLATVLLQGPASLSSKAGAGVRTFLVGTLFNVLRILALGTAVGCLSARRTGDTR
jgi:hypothetical protein